LAFNFAEDTLRHIKPSEALALVHETKEVAVAFDDRGRIRAVQLIAKHVPRKSNASISARESVMNALASGRHPDTLTEGEEAAVGKTQVWQEVHDVRAPLAIQKTGGG
jgi:hypothetical protein